MDQNSNIFFALGTITGFLLSWGYSKTRKKEFQNPYDILKERDMEDIRAIFIFELSEYNTTKALMLAGLSFLFSSFAFLFSISQFFYLPQNPNLFAFILGNFMGIALSTIYYITKIFPSLKDIGTRYQEARYSNKVQKVRLEIKNKENHKL